MYVEPKGPNECFLHSFGSHVGGRGRCVGFGRIQNLQLLIQKIVQVKVQNLSNYLSNSSTGFSQNNKQLEYSSKQLVAYKKRIFNCGYIPRKC